MSNFEPVSSQQQDLNRLRQGMDDFWIKTNLTFLAAYWAQASASLAALGEEQAGETKSDHGGAPPELAGAIVANHLEHHHYGGVLLAYAAFDEFMTVLTERLGASREVPIKPNDLRDRGVKRYRKFIHQVCAVPAKDVDIDWEFLEDFATVRNAIIHANGNRSHLGSPKQLDEVVNRRGPALAYKHQVKLVVTDDYVRACLTAVRRAAISLNSATA